MSGDEKVLSYYDVLLRRLDVEQLDGPHWLNDQVGLMLLDDACRWCKNHTTASMHGFNAYQTPACSPQIISFWFEYLSRERFESAQDTIALVPPPTAFLLLHTDPSVSTELLTPLKLPTKQLVLFAVSDNPDTEHAGGGSHWSLLAFHRPSNTFLHFDSSPGCGNQAPARLLAGAAAPLVCDRSATAAAGNGDALRPKFDSCGHAPHQRNGYDCGVYVMAVARQLCEWQEAAPGKVLLQLEQLPGLVTAAAVRGLRREVLQLIESKGGSRG